MQLALPSYLLIAAGALLGVVSLWTAVPWLAGLWAGPLLLLAAGLAWEGARLRRRPLSVRLETPLPAFLGTPQPGAFVLESDGPLSLEYLPALPALCSPLEGIRRLALSATRPGRDEILLIPQQLGEEGCPDLTARLAGALHLAWWPRTLPVTGRLRVTPPLAPPGLLSGRLPGGRTQRRLPGTGRELHQLRGHRRGDPLSLIDWKATVRAGELISRELAAQTEQDLLLLLDAGVGGRRAQAGLTRHTHHAAAAAVLAQGALAQGARAGLVLFAHRPLAAVAPARGWATLSRIRSLLTDTPAQALPSDLPAAALALRALLRRRTWIVLLTDLDEETLPAALGRAAGVLLPAHRLIVAGLEEPGIAQLGRQPARTAEDAWIALAAQAHLARMQAQQRALRRLGLPLISAAPAQLGLQVQAALAPLGAAARATGP